MKGLELEQIQRVFIPVSRHIDNHARIIAQLFPNEPAQFNPVPVPHHNVQKNQIIMPFLKCFLKLLTGVEYLHLQPASLFPSPDIVLQLAAHLKVIITYCYLYHAPVPVPQF